MLESALKRKVLSYLKQRYPDAYIVKVSDRWVAGIPDIFMCLRGHFVALELKAPKGVVAKIQQATLDKIDQAGGTALVVRSIDDLAQMEGGEHGERFGPSIPGR